MAARFKQTKARGFTLIEMMVALVIMALIGLMAWRGLDGLVRGKERLESHAEQQRDLQYALTLLDRDCLSMVIDDQVGQPVALGSRSVWWLRNTTNGGMPAWQIVGYRSQSDGLYRAISSVFPTKEKALEAWKGVATAADGGYSQVDLQLISKQIVRQDTTVLSNVPNSALPVKGLKVLWFLASNQPGNEQPVTRICLAGGAR